MAERLLERARAQGAGRHDAALEARFVQTDAFRASLRGDTGSMTELYAQAVLAYERAGLSRHACNARVSHGFGLMELGRFEEAAGRLHAAAQEAERLGLGNVRVAALTNLGWALARMGRWEEGANVEEEASRALERYGDKRMEAASRTYAAAIAAERGDLERAEREARRAVGLLERFPALRAYAFAMLAEVLRRRGSSEALARARDARASLEAHGAEEGEAFVRLVDAELALAHGDTATAFAGMHGARARLLERASRISSPEARESFLTRVPEHARTLALAREWLGE